MSHTCHATGCVREVAPAFFMCKAHWYMVPTRLRLAIWRHYRAGQEIDKKPSRAYCLAAKEAVTEVARMEKRTPDTRLYDLLLTGRATA